MTEREGGRQVHADLIIQPPKDGLSPTVVPFGSLVEIVHAVNRGDTITSNMVPGLGEKRTAGIAAARSDKALAEVLDEFALRSGQLVVIAQSLRETAYDPMLTRRVLLKGLGVVIAASGVGSMGYLASTDNRGEVENADAVDVSDKDVAELDLVPESTHDLLPGGFYIAGAGIEILPTGVQSLLNEYPNVGIKYELRSPHVDIIPTVRIGHNNVSVVNAERSAVGNNFSVRLGLLPRTEFDHDPDAILEQTVYFPDGTTDVAALTEISFPSYRYNLPKNIALFASHVVGKEVLDTISSIVPAGKDFLGETFDVRMYDGPSFSHEVVDAIPEYIREMADPLKDIVLPESIKKVSRTVQERIVLYETSRIIAANFDSYNVSLEARQLYQDMDYLLTTYVNHLKQYYYSKDAPGKGSGVALARGDFFEHDPVLSLFSINTYAYPGRSHASLIYHFGTTQNIIDFIANGLTVWTLFGEQFSETYQRIIKGRDSGIASCATALTEKLLSIASIVQPDPIMQEGFIKGLPFVKKISGKNK